MEAQYTLSTFTPSEAEAITGLSTTMQRDWRRREFLPRGDGHARFDAFALAQMMVMKALADRGIGPQQTVKIAEWAAGGLCWEAMGWKDAFEGDFEQTYDWLPEDQRPSREPSADVLKVLSHLNDEARAEADLHGMDGSWGAKSQFLRKQVLRLKGIPRVIPARFLVWWANGDHCFTVDLGRAFDSVSSGDERVAGPAIVLDLNALASNLIDRTGRPLVHVEYPTNDQGEIQPPIEYGAPVAFSPAVLTDERRAEAEAILAHTQAILAANKNKAPAQ
ncbi:MAG: hypothetical protein ACRED4_02780 [Brevundimonas sp.]